MSNLYESWFDAFSVEANGDQPPLINYPDDISTSGNINSIFDDIIPGLADVDGVCSIDNLADAISTCDVPNDLDFNLNSLLSTDVQVNIDYNLLALSTAPLCSTGKTKKRKDNKKPILLSSSVGVGVPVTPLQPVGKLHVVHDLEEKYRPRYKSDYFGQNGRIRKPRYVADRKGNHYITLKVTPNTHGQIRVDWVSVPGENNKRYSMPHRFQAHNELSEVADCNPIFESFVSDASGTVKLYLVLIKTKQDALRSLQPLQPFHPLQDAFGIVDKPIPEKLKKMTPKQLIRKYQLGKSQLAFTLCMPNPNGQSYYAAWETTVYSTVLEEMSEPAASKIVSCPNCSCSITINDEATAMPEPTEKKRKNEQPIIAKSLMLKKQRTLPEEIFPIIYN